jgi:hypothetical protein
MLAEEVLDRFVEEGREDHVGLWQIVRAVREDLGVSDADEVRRVTLELVGALLRERGMIAGRPSLDWRGFIPWQLAPEAAVRRIEEEWLALGRDPNLWEIVWFDTLQGGRTMTKWERQYTAFRQLLPDLMKTHAGQYVAIHEGRVVDVDPNELVLIERVLGRVGNVSIHVGLVADSEPVARLTNVAMTWTKEDLADLDRSCADYANRSIPGNDLPPGAGKLAEGEEPRD